MAIMRLAVLTHGADGPGMNAAIRASVRMAIHQGWEAFGVRGGFPGLLGGEFEPLGPRSVSGLIERGGTYLGTSETDLGEEQRVEGLQQLARARIDALVVIGGRQAIGIAAALGREGLAIVGVPASIENDLPGTDDAIGADTALNTALDAIDRIKDTASSQQEAFVVQVAGRCSGRLALRVGVAGGAEVLCIPENPCQAATVARLVADAYQRGKPHCIVVVAEGARPGAVELAQMLEAQRAEVGFESHLVILSHLQRGGTPTANDRIQGTRLGAEAVRRLAQGERGVMVGLIDGQMVTTPLATVAAHPQPLDRGFKEMADMLAR